MKLSFPKFGNSQKSANPALGALKSQLATPEGLEALLIAAQGKKELTKATHHAAHMHWCRVCDEILRITEKSKLDAWRAAAAQSRESSLAELQNASTEAEQALALANDAFLAAEQRLAAIDARIDPLNVQRRAVEAETAQKKAEAREKFNQAMLSGDEAAQEAASMSLIDANQIVVQKVAGPLLLRIEALRAQRTEAESDVLASKKSRDSAEADLLKARAGIALVRSDEAAVAAIDAYVSAAAAIREAGGLPADFRPIDPPVLQFSRASHAVHASRLNVYSNRVTSPFTLVEMASLVPEPRYELLLSPEPTEEGNPAKGPVQTNEPDGSDEYGRLADGDNASDQQQFYRQSGHQAIGARA